MTAETLIEVFDGNNSAESAQVAEAVRRLVPQLSSSAPDLSAAEIAALAQHEACTVLLAKLPAAAMSDSTNPASGTATNETFANEIVGVMMLVVFPLLTGVRAWIEDVVVDESARGKGIGEALNRRAIEIAAAAGARTVDLTSRPSREAANRLYQRIGFEPRSTNIYRLDLN